MSKDSNLKEQRDRFLAFAFAGADFLLEIDGQGCVTFAAGATKSMTGFDDSQIRGRNYLDFFAADDRVLLGSLNVKWTAGTKKGPYFVTLLHSDQSTTTRAFVTGISMPDDDSIYLSFARGDGLLRILGFEKDTGEPAKLVDAKAFETLIQKKIPEMMASGRNADLTFIELGGLDRTKAVDGDFDTFFEAVAATMMEHSLDGEAAADLQDGRYVLLQDRDKSPDALRDQIMDIARKFELGDVLDVKEKKIESDLPNLSARETSRAIIHTMNQMEQRGIDKLETDLKKSFRSFLDENTAKIKTLKNTIAHQRFTVHFQPIVDLSTRGVSHHEVLMRFDENISPYELIVLSEDVGMAPDLDMAVCRQALKFADKNKHNNIGKLAVNLSGASVQMESFIDTLLGSLREYPDAAKHIAFELTESTTIRDLDFVNNFVQKLRLGGHAVCLDDFGAGAASFQYLHKLHVDGVKIDGAYIKTILTSPRDATLIKNLTQMCHELDVYVVAEMIETEAQYKYLRDIGIDKGQGWLFGKASPALMKD